MGLAHQKSTSLDGVGINKLTLSDLGIWYNLNKLNWFYRSHYLHTFLTNLPKLSKYLSYSRLYGHIE